VLPWKTKKHGILWQIATHVENTHDRICNFNLLNTQKSKTRLFLVLTSWNIIRIIVARTFIFASASCLKRFFQLFSTYNFWLEIVFQWHHTLFDYFLQWFINLFARLVDKPILFPTTPKITFLGGEKVLVSIQFEKRFLFLNSWNSILQEYFVHFCQDWSEVDIFCHLGRDFVCGRESTRWQIASFAAYFLCLCVVVVAFVGILPAQSFDPWRK